MVDHSLADNVILEFSQNGDETGWTTEPYQRKRSLINFSNTSYTFDRSVLKISGQRETMADLFAYELGNSAKAKHGDLSVVVIWL